MPSHDRFHIRALDELRAEIARLDLDIPLSDDLSVLGQPLPLGGLTLPNRFVVQPMEGFDAEPDGAPGPLAFRRYERYARGGFGLIWVEATAVLREARTNPRQLFLHAGNVDGYRRLADAIRRAAREAFGWDVALVIQLTHSGRYSKPDGTPRPLIAHHSPVLDPVHALPPDYPLVTDAYLDRLQETFAAAARLAREAGFDGVDIKSCHRYLLSELHASFTREGRYGGSFENRTRLLRETVARIRRETPELRVTTRLNAYDGMRHPYGFGVDRQDERTPDLAEPLQLVAALRALGLPLLNVSIGNPYYNPHLGRPFDFPVQGLPAPEEHPLRGLARFMGITRRIQQAFPDLPVVGSGYSWLRQFLPHVAAGAVHRGGATLVGIGRGAFAYPDAVKDILRTGRMDPAKCCVTCSACTQIMRDGGMTGCVVRDSAIYGPEYRRGRRFALDRLLEEARRCRECEAATCTSGCPAHVDVPAFVRAFADQDIPRAYDVLRASNALPEMCAYVCPAEVQCEGGCLETIFCAHPIPIRDIQLLACRLARRRGLTGVRLPPEPSGRRIAVVGGGPAGIAGAIKLLERGHAVTVFERGERLGGIPEDLIPFDRYETSEAEIAAILAPARDAGRIDIRYGQALGRNLELEELRAAYDAVLLAIGLGSSPSLGQAEGVVDALSFLREVKQGRRRDVPRRVAVLGGGNTAMDAAVTARRLGAADVYLVYRRSFAEMPAWPEERERFMASGGHCLILTQPVGYETDPGGRVTGVRIARTELGAPDASGRRRPEAVPDTESVLQADLVIEALGQTLPDDLRSALRGLAFGRGGLIRTAAPDSAATGVAGVFAAGDLVSGGATVVESVREGMAAAEEMDRLLRGRGRGTPC